MRNVHEADLFTFRHFGDPNSLLLSALLHFKSSFDSTSSPRIFQVLFLAESDARLDLIGDQEASRGSLARH